MKENDEKILKLKEQIETKKNEIEKVKKFNPITNCIIELDGNKYNLQAIQKDNLVLLIIKLNMYRISFLDLKLETQLMICGYDINDWITDCKARLSNILIKEEENKLKAMESKLHKLLSDDKKIELEIAEIENLLK